MRRFIRFLFAALTVANSGAAHEFWIEPLQFTFAPDQPIEAGFFVGQNLTGDEFPFLSSRSVGLSISDHSVSWFLSPREGDRPAIRVATDAPGQYLLTYQSHPSHVTYESFAKFQLFLVAEGLTEFEQVHRQRGLPEAGFREAFTRYAKSIVRVGTGDFDLPQNQPMRFDWELLNDPFAGGPVEMRLTWQGAPVPHHPVTLIGQNMRQRLMTRSDGAVTVPRINEPILVNAVKLEPLSATALPWHSHWASFMLPMQRQISD